MMPKAARSATTRTMKRRAARVRCRRRLSGARRWRSRR